MPKIKCKCGNIISFGEIPNPNEWLIISDKEYDSFSTTINMDELYDKVKSMMICNQCGRLWIYWDGFTESPTVYKIDDD